MCSCTVKYLTNPKSSYNKLQTSWKELGLYPVYNRCELGRSCVVALRLHEKILGVSMFRSCFRKIIRTDFWPATSCAIRLTIRSIASWRKPFLRHRGKSGNHTGKAGKIFLKNFFQIFDKLQNFCYNINVRRREI